MVGKSYIVLLAAILGIIATFKGDMMLMFIFLSALFYCLYRNKANMQLLLLASLAFTLFFFHPFLYKHIPPLPTTDKIIGTINSIPKIDGNKLSFEMKTGKDKTVLTYFMKTQEEQMELKKLVYGMKCAIAGNYSLPQNATNFHQFDYREFLQLRGIYYVFTANRLHISDCQVEKKSFYQWLQVYRQYGIEFINSHFPKESSGMVIALVFGDRNNLSHDLLNSYQSLGIIHLLAVSGLHVGLLVASVYYLLIRFVTTKEKAITILLFTLPFYAILAGAAPSVLRATLMAMIVLATLRSSINVHPLDGISYVCLFLLLVNPLYLFHLGFQLSFLISFGLIISSKSILNRFDHWFFQMAAVTALSQLLSFPLIIYHFYEISFLSIPVNLFYIPFITFFLLPFSFISVIIYSISPFFGELVVMFYTIVLVWAHKIVLFINNIPFTQLTLGKPPIYLVMFYLIAIGVGLVTWERAVSLRDYLKGVCYFCLILMIHWNLPYVSNNGEVTMIDVGQGESILIELPYRKGIYLIDTGGHVDFRNSQDWAKRSRNFEVGNDILLPFLKARGIRKIDKLILTHGHFDHIGGASALLGKVKVKQLLYGYGPIETPLEKQLLMNFQDYGTQIQFVKKGDYWRNGNYLFSVLAPVGGEDSLNNRSVVIYGELGRKKWLFTGDLENEGEQLLLANYPQLPVDVLKVGHHGSNTSTMPELLNRINPSYALIPVGKNNVYGHPNREVIERLVERDIAFFRTDLHGAIKYSFKGNKIGTFSTKISR